MKVIDSHTIGEPTRIVIEGGPDLGDGPLRQRAQKLTRDHDWLRRATCLEPRGHEAMVGGLLVEPHEQGCDFGVIFFNNHGTLGMCIHGTMGLVATLRHLGRLSHSACRIDTPVGPVAVEWAQDGTIQVTNVASYRLAADVVVEVPEYGPVRGDIAWGGNWFYLLDGHGPPIEQGGVGELTVFALKVRQALLAAGIRADDGHEIDHIELFGPADGPAEADSRNFVLCPGGAYDRSPCGTGLSAKLACLAAAGRLEPGQVWRQASILNQIFEGCYQSLGGGEISPQIRGKAWITGESIYRFDPDDPFAHGIG